MKILVNKKEIKVLKHDMLEELEKIDSEVKCLEKLKNQFIWQGDGHDALIIKYDKTIEDYQKKIKIIGIYIEFLDMVLYDYDDVMNKIKIEFNKLKVEGVKNGR